MKVAILTAVTLAAMTLSASAQQCVHCICPHSNPNCSWRVCNPHCCSYDPRLCIRGGPIHPVPPGFWPPHGPGSTPGLRGGIGIK